MKGCDNFLTLSNGWVAKDEVVVGESSMIYIVGGSLSVEWSLHSMCDIGVEK